MAALPVAETVKRGAEGWVKATIPRDGLWAIQTPQGFRAELLREAHRRAAADRIVGTDDAALVERLGAPRVRLVPGLPGNLKITPPRTCRWRGGPPGEWRGPAGGGARALPMTRVGLGFDVHPLVDGPPSSWAASRSRPTAGWRAIPTPTS